MARTTTRTSPLPPLGSETSSPPASSPQASLTTETYSSSSPQTSPSSLSAIASPASVDGPTPFDLPAGTTLDLFGQAHAPASPSQAQLEAARLRLICGRSSGGSSRQYDLACSLGSRFHREA